LSKVTLFLLCLFIAMMPFEAIIWFEEAPSGAKLLGVVVAATAMVAFLAGQPVRMPSRPLVMRILITLMCVMSFAWSINQEDTLVGISRLAQLLIFVLLIWEFAVTYEEQLWIMRAFLIGMFVPMAMALVAFRGASRFEIESGERFTGGGHDLNYLAYMCSVSVLFCAYLATGRRPIDRMLRWCYWGFAIWIALQAILTGSRGGLLSLLLAGLVAMLLARVSRRRIVEVFQILGLVALVYVLAKLVVPSELLSRAALGGAGGTSLEDDPRMRIWRAGLIGFWRCPLVGVGFDGFFTVTEQVTGERRAPHNTFISVLVELGVVGLVLYVAYVVMLFRSAWRLPRREKLLWIGILLISVLNAVTCGSQRDKFTWLLYAMVLVQEAALAPAGKRRGKPLPRGAAAPVAPPLRPGLRRS
jgi:O-antigen ligase